MKIKYDKDTRSYSVLNQEGQKEFAKKGGGGNPPNNPPKPVEKDPKKYFFEKILLEKLQDLQQNNNITSYKRVGDSYAIEMRNKTAIICYITDDGMYVFTKLDLVTGGHVGASDPSEPNALICGPERIKDALTTVSNIRDDYSFLRKLWRKYFG